MNNQLQNRGFGGLALILGGALKIQNKAELEEFLEQPKAREHVRSVPYQDVFMVTKTVGLADSLELLALTSKEQRRGFIDLDCWRKDSFHVQTFMEWLAAFIQCGPEETVRLARSVDPEILAYFLKQYIKVYELDPEEPAPDALLTLTPDRRYGIEIIGEEEAATMAHLLLDAVFRFDTSLGYDLIDRVCWGNLVALEEEAYQNKRRRLEEIGFVDYYEALDLYGETPVIHLPKISIPRADSEEEVPGSRTLPALFVAALAPADYLREGLQRLTDQKDIERITFSLAALANRILSVHSVNPGDLEKVKPALGEMHDTLSLGMEYLSGSEPTKAIEVLTRYELQTIFQSGFQLVANLRSRADRILSRGGLKLKDGHETLLDFPESEFFSGLRRQRPLFFEGLVDAKKSSYRNFQNLVDLELSTQVLDQIEILSRSFWNLWQEPGKQIIGDWPVGANLTLNEVCFSQLFNTALLNCLLQNNFVVEFLNPEDVLAFLSTAFEQQGGTMNFQKWLISEAEAHIAGRIGRQQDRIVLISFTTRWVAAFMAEFLPHIHSDEIDARFLKSVLLRVNPK